MLHIGPGKWECWHSRFWNFAWGLERCIWMVNIQYSKIMLPENILVSRHLKSFKVMRACEYYLYLICKVLRIGWTDFLNFFAQTCARINDEMWQSPIFEKIFRGSGGGTPLFLEVFGDFLKNGYKDFDEIVLVNSL